MNTNNPAQDGIDGAREDARKQAIAARMINEFKAFVLESMQDGSVINLDDINSDLEILDVIKDGMQIYYDLAKAEME